MSEAIGQSLSFAIGVAISPIPIIGVVLMLATARARANGPAFLAGWIAGVAGVGAIVLLVSSGGGASDAGEPASWVAVLKLVLGVLLLGLAVRQWRGRPRAGEEPKMPSWLKSIDRFTATRAAAFGVVLSADNPKNLLLIVGGAAAIAGTGASTGSQAAALAVFVVVATLGTGTPVVLYFALGDRSRVILDELKDWLAAHNAAIMTVLLLVLGVKLLGDGLAGI
jgi:threonine/homoserine/homoserine lactone efflux protein